MIQERRRRRHDKSERRVIWLFRAQSVTMCGK